MLTSLRNTHTEFFKEFQPQVTILDGTTPIVFPVHYARESKKDLTQGRKESYPQISILDYLPEFDPSWADNGSKRFDGFRTTNGKVSKTLVYEEPLKFLLRYDVTAFTKNPLHRLLIWEYFLKAYKQSGSIIFNKVEVSTTQYDQVVGDVVNYTMTPTEVNRTDGVFELNFEFALKPFIAVREPEDMDTVQSLLINNQDIL